MQKEKYHCMGLVRGRQAWLLYVQKITTECPNMPTKCTAILEYFIAAFQERDIEMKDAPIFNPKKASNDRKRKRRTKMGDVLPPVLDVSEGRHALAPRTTTVSGPALVRLHGRGLR